MAEPVAAFPLWISQAESRMSLVHPHLAGITLWSEITMRSTISHPGPIPPPLPVKQRAYEGVDGGLPVGTKRRPLAALRYSEC